MVRLEPDTGCINRVAVRGKTLVPLVDVRANVFDALDHVVLVMRNLVQIALAAVPLKDSANINVVAIRSARLIFVFDYRLNRVSHRLVIGRTHALNVWRKANGLDSRQARKRSPAKEVEPPIVRRYILKSERGQ